MNEVPTTTAARALVGAVTSALLLGVLAAPAAHADSWRDAQWYLDTFDIEAVHAISTGEGVTIGLIDSGTDITHPDLQGADIVAGTGYGTIDDPFVDERDHGTSMAALLVGQGHGSDGVDGVLGIAPDARLIVSSLNWDESSKGELEGWQAQAVQEMVDLDVDVIVSSIVGGSGAQHQMKAAIAAAKEAGIPFVVAAGNNSIDVIPGCRADEECWEGAPTEDETVVYDGLDFPAAYHDVVPVFAHMSDGSQWEKSPRVLGVALGVSAPGGDLVAASAGGGYTIQSGTSGAAPLVAATFALARAIHPDAAWDQLINLVLGSVEDGGDPGFDEVFGWGRLDPLAALTASLPPSVENTTEPSGPTAGPVEEDEPLDNRMPLWLQNTISVAVLLVLLALIVVPIVLVRRRVRRRRQTPPGSDQPMSPST